MSIRDNVLLGKVLILFTTMGSFVFKIFTLKLTSFILFAKTFFLLPVLYFQGKKIRQTVPKLPEATGPSGISGRDYDQPLRMVCLGESTIAGVGVRTHKDGFVGALATTLATQLKRQIVWEVVARSGYTVKSVRHKLLSRISNNPQLIIVGLGGNDAFTLNRPTRWVAEIRALIKSLKKDHPEAVIAFTNMPPIKIFPAFTKSIKGTVGSLVELLGQELEVVVQEFDAVYYNKEVINLEVWKKRYNISGDVSEFFSDGVHPSELTYQVWGKDFAAYLLKTTEIKQIK